jgi:hypothetical protein
VHLDENGAIVENEQASDDRHGQKIEIIEV